MIGPLHSDAVQKKPYRERAVRALPDVPADADRRTARPCVARDRAGLGPHASNLRRPSTRAVGAGPPFAPPPLGVQGLAPKPAPQKAGDSHQRSGQD